MGPFQIGCIVLGILLAISAAGNAYQLREHDKVIVKEAATQQLATDITASAKACSEGVEALSKKGDTNRREILAAVDGTKNRIAGLQHEAIDAIKGKPDDPKDLCGSLDRRLRELIRKEREGAK